MVISIVGSENLLSYSGFMVRGDPDIDTTDKYESIFIALGSCRVIFTFSPIEIGDFISIL